MNPHFQQLLALRGKVSIIFIFILIFASSSFSRAQLLQESPKRQLEIRSGVHGVIGGSQLYMDDAVRPSQLSSENYQFGLDVFLKVGAMITVQPAFLGDHFQLVTDPAFSKYSWGNFRSQFTDSIEYEIDIDLESIELPLSLRFTILPYSRVVRPFIRAGYTFAWIIETEAQFRASMKTEYTYVEYLSSDFNFAYFQHRLMAAAGVELNFRYVDYTFELVCQQGGAIDRRSNGSIFSALSHTTSYYFQMGILF